MRPERGTRAPGERRGPRLPVSTSRIAAALTEAGYKLGPGHHRREDLLELCRQLNITVR